MDLFSITPKCRTKTKNIDFRKIQNGNKERGITSTLELLSSGTACLLKSWVEIFKQRLDICLG